MYPVKMGPQGLVEGGTGAPEPTTQAAGGASVLEAAPAQPAQAPTSQGAEGAAAPDVDFLNTATAAMARRRKGQVHDLRRENAEQSAKLEKLEAMRQNFLQRAPTIKKALDEEIPRLKAENAEVKQNLALRTAELDVFKSSGAQPDPAMMESARAAAVQQQLATAVADLTRQIHTPPTPAATAMPAMAQPAAAPVAQTATANDADCMAYFDREFQPITADAPGIEKYRNDILQRWWTGAANGMTVDDAAQDFIEDQAAQSSALLRLKVEQSRNMPRVVDGGGTAPAGRPTGPQQPGDRQHRTLAQVSDMHHRGELETLRTLA